MGEYNEDMMCNGNGHVLPNVKGHGFHNSNGPLTPEANGHVKLESNDELIPPSNQWEYTPGDPTKLIKLPKFPYEFAGPLGTLGITIGFPAVCYAGAFLCNDISGCPVPSLLHPSSFSLEAFKQDIGWPRSGIWGIGSWEVTAWTLAYYFLSLVLQVILPGDDVQGTLLRDGGRLKYKFNAFSSSTLIMVVAGAGTVLHGADFVLWTWIWDNYLQLLTANVAISYFLATFCYIRSFSVKPNDPSHRMLAAGGASGNIIYDWFIGRELNPRITLPLLGEIDIKMFCEVRPGLLGWALLNFAFMARQYKIHGFLSDSMLLVNAFQVVYVFESLWTEASCLTMMDITTDGFGLMLAYGDLAWLPFLYSWESRYLAVYPLQLGWSAVLGISAVQVWGYYIFRASNNQKNWFRVNPKDPRVAHLTYMETEKGSKLLTSGWWGMARHINYLGDWIMAWSYCLPTGIAGYVVQQGETATMFDGQPSAVVQGAARGWGMLITYFYILYFAALVGHRQTRDETKCLRKYGKDWEEYKKLVPYRIIPGIY